MQDPVYKKSNYHRILWILGFYLISLHLACQQIESSSTEVPLQIMTVDGPIPTDSLGLTLIHEHVFLDWSGADSIKPTLWKAEEAYEIILPYLKEMKSHGVRSFFECTPAYLGRNPSLLKRLAKASGLQIITNTGYYAARKNRYLPTHAYTDNADDLASRWIKEYQQGIGQSRIYPGFIKIGMDSKPQLTDMDTKLVRAAARTHLATGLTIVAHTGDDTTAIQEINLLEEEGVAPDAFVWTHAQNGTAAGHVRLAQMGAWVSLDGLGWIRPDASSRDSSRLFKYVNWLKNLKENQLLHRTLIAHDAGWYTVREADQSKYKAYTPIFELLLPVLRDHGFTEVDIHQLLVENPKEAYGIKIRVQ